MSQSDEEERPVTPAPIQLSQESTSRDESDDVNVASIAKPTPYVLEYIRDYWGPSKAEMSFKCRSKHCNKEIKYSSTSFANLKTHYKNLHPAEHADFLAALSAGYAYKKRGRNSSGAR
jgi:hypothetical protein